MAHNPFHRPAHDDAHSVTTVRANPAQDRHHREMQYLLAMAFRIICFGGAMLTTGPVRWVAIVVAVFMPWIAVLLANNTGSATHVRVDPGTRGLGTAAQGSARPTAPQTGDVIVGTIHLPDTPQEARTD